VRDMTNFWTFEEIGTLIDLKLRNYRWCDIAFGLERTEIACKRKYERIKRKMYK